MLVSDFLVMLITAVVVHVRFVAFSLALLAKRALRVVVALVPMAVAVIWLLSLSETDSFVPTLTAVIACGVVGSGLYFGTLRVLRHPELLSAWDMALQRFSLLRGMRSRRM